MVKNGGVTPFKRGSFPLCCFSILCSFLGPIRQGLRGPYDCDRKNRRTSIENLSQLDIAWPLRNENSLYPQGEERKDRRGGGEISRIMRQRKGNANKIDLTPLMPLTNLR